MLVDYLDKTAQEISAIKERERRLHRKYEETLDIDLRREIAELQKKIKIKTYETHDRLFENMAEFRLLKKHFPRLFQAYLEDEDVGRMLKEKEWLADFNTVHKGEGERKLWELKAEIKTLKSFKSELRNAPGPFNKKTFGKSWDLVKDKVTERTDNHEMQDILDNKITELRHEGWLMLLNEPFVIKQMNRFVERLKKALKEEDETKKKYESSQGMGTYQEYRAKQAYDKTARARKKAERMCRHLVLANPAFYHKIAKESMVWRDKFISQVMARMLKSMIVPVPDENEWVKEMKKKLES
jgi:hypothetical protein